MEWTRWEILPWRTGDGSVGGIMIFAEDITEQKEAEDRLRLAATVFTGAREGIVITDPAGTILEVNDAFTRITGYTREEVLGRNPRMLQSGLQSKEFYENMWGSLVRDGHWSGEIWNRTKSGDIFAEMLTINAIHDANGDVVQYVGTVHRHDGDQGARAAAGAHRALRCADRASQPDAVRRPAAPGHGPCAPHASGCWPWPISTSTASRPINDRYGHADAATHC